MSQVSTSQQYLVEALAGAMRDSLECAFESFIRDHVNMESLGEHVAERCATQIQNLDAHISIEVERRLDQALQQRSFSRRLWKFLTQRVC